jgi:squalene-hopene/tetraprenyl-beta-curcumene cyclase
MTPTARPALSPASLQAAVQRAAEAVLSLQHPGGYWWADLTADSTLESDAILLELFLHPPVNGVWNPPRRDRIERAAQAILERQLPDGGFWIYPEGPGDVSATVKAYFALKLAGLPASDGRMERARSFILRSGGIQAANSYVKLNLSLFGLYPREFVPSVPPEMTLLPGEFLYQMSSWTRTIVVPLSVVHAANPMRPVPRGFDLGELFLPGAPLGFPRDDKLLSWRNVFLAADRFLKLWERFGPKSVRRRAIRRAESWMLERVQDSDGLGAIYPPMMYFIMALDVLGYAPDHPVRVEAERQFYGLLTEEEDRFFFQPCFSPVWDTAIAMQALGEAGFGGHPALLRGAQWLLQREIRRRGDWSVKRPHLEPSGWCFEFRNEWYPDIDDTAQVLLGLHASQAPIPDEVRLRAVAWLKGMQSADGGWAAFDADNNWEFLNQVPFADHNAMLDPTCPDITGRVLEALAACGVSPAEPCVRRGVRYLTGAQQPDGSWYGRWGVAYIYGTFLALRGLRASGEDPREAHILRAGEWLRAIQNADGGWGESCASYDEGGYAPARSTPSQTAWALLGLAAGGDLFSASVRKGVEHLIETQRSDGTWDEDLATGTGFPRVFYLTYHLYRNVFPLLALAEISRLQRGVNP